MEKVRLSFDSTNILRDALKKKLNSEGRSMKWFLNNAIKLYLKNEINDY